MSRMLLFFLVFQLHTSWALLRTTVTQKSPFRLFVSDFAEKEVTPTRSVERENNPTRRWIPSSATAKMKTKYKRDRNAHYKPSKRKLRSQNSDLSENNKSQQDGFTYIQGRPGMPRVLALSTHAKCDSSYVPSTITAFNDIVKENLRCSLRECNMLLKNLGDGGHLKACEKILNMMELIKIQPSMVTYSTLISRAGMWSQAELAEYYYELMIKKGFKPDVQAYNSLINAYAKSKSKGTGTISHNDGENTERALRVLQEMYIAKVEPTVITFNTIMDSCAREGQVDEAEKILQSMQKRTPQIQPNSRSYSALIFACCRAGELDRAFEVLQTMRDIGMKPNEVTYSQLLHGLGQSGKLDKAFELVETMKTMGISPNVVTMSTLVHACASNDRLDVAFELYDEMDQSYKTEDRPNSVTCSSLIDASLKADPPHVDRAYKVLTDMKARGLPLTEVTYTSLITELPRLDDDECAALLELCHSSPTLTEVAGGKKQAVFDVYEQMKTSGVAPGERVFKTLIESTSSSTIPLTTLTTIPNDNEDIEDNVIDGDDNHTSYISPMLSTPESENSEHTSDKGLGMSEHTLLQLYLVFGEMRAANVKADVAAYNTLINACAGAGEVDKALDVVRTMRLEGLEPDVITYTSLIKACRYDIHREGRTALAEEIFGAMQQRDNHFSQYIPPSARTYAWLMELYASADSTEDKSLIRVDALLHELIEQRLQPSKRALRACTRAAVKRGDYRLALEALDSIRTHCGDDDNSIGYDTRAWSWTKELLLRKKAQEDGPIMSRLTSEIEEMEAQLEKYNNSY